MRPVSLQKVVNNQEIDWFIETFPGTCSQGLSFPRGVTHRG